MHTEEKKPLQLAYIIKEDTSYDVSPEEAVEIIKRKCSKFLQESKNNKLFRGTTNIKDNNLLQQKQIRIRTKSNGRYKQFFDGTNYQMNKTNSPIIRQYALNTTGSQNTSLMYGTPHQIFMINNYKYMWSPIIEDYINITININKIFTKKESDKYLQQFKQIQNNQFEVGKWYWNLIKNQYKFNNLPQAIKSGNEILFSNDDGYLAMNTTHPDYKEIIKNKLL